MTHELNRLAAMPEPSAVAGAHCRPSTTVTSLRPIFSAVERYPEIVNEIRDSALPVFLRWGFWQNETTRKTSAIRPVRWILANCPELRTRAILGPGLDAEILSALRSRPASASELSRDLGYRYASVHEAAERLAGRGLVTASVSRREHLLTTTAAAQELLA